MKLKTFSFISLGCKVNSYELSALESDLIKEGLTYVELDQDPDLIIINTCSVTAMADKKSRQHIRSARMNHPNSKIITMGCYSQKMHDFIFNDLKVDIVTGTSHRKDTLSHIYDDKPIDLTQENPFKFDYEEISSTSHFENVRAYLKIQDGCSNFCSYCLIPYLRGRCRSRKREDVLKEARNIIAKGYKEIVLTGIHVGGYGYDLDGYSFSNLLEDLLDIKGLERLTISSIEESEIDDKFIELLKTRKNLAMHLHIPLQSGSSSVLKRMNRKYNTMEFKKTLDKIHQACPDIFIATDVITGFPGETEAEFKETYDFILSVGFNALHCFPFSEREGTKAYDMPDQVDMKVRKDRCRELIALSKKLEKEYYQRFKGKNLNVLVEKYDPETKKCSGHSENFIEFSFDGTPEMVNTIVNVKYE